jgi:hypothetical protein
MGDTNEALVEESRDSLSNFLRSSPSIHDDAIALEGFKDGVSSMTPTIMEASEERITSRPTLK